MIWLSLLNNILELGDCMDDRDVNFSSITIEELYKQLNINIDDSFDIVKLSQEYHEKIAFMEKECFNTMAYNNR